MRIDNESFVPIHIQEALEIAGWKLKHSTFTNEAKNMKLYPDGKMGMQTWKLNYAGGVERQLDISYDYHNEYKNVTLWYSDNESETFKLRTILAVLKRRGLL